MQRHSYGYLSKISNSRSGCAGWRGVAWDGGRRVNRGGSSGWSSVRGVNGRRVAVQEAQQRGFADHADKLPGFAYHRQSAGGLPHLAKQIGHGRIGWNRGDVGQESVLQAQWPINAVQRGAQRFGRHGAQIALTRVHDGAEIAVVIFN